MVGLIGRNGAGKSTLLKILSRITYPTSGEVVLRGRVASLLEVGTGFSPELTGRENIFLNGAILGMPRKEIKNKFDEIVDFAEVERFLDTPVKHYSSGMYMRLAFAVAAHLEPDILLVDEVLAVGDAEFQKKCLGKMEEVTTKQGRTIIFVSHNMNAVRAICQKSILINNGKIIKFDETNTVINNYLKEPGTDKQEIDYRKSKNLPGTDLIKIEKVTIKSTSQQKLLSLNEPFIYSVNLFSQKNISRFNLSVSVFSKSFGLVFVTNSPVHLLTRGSSILSCEFPEDLFNSGTYSFVLSLVIRSRNEFQLKDAVEATFKQVPDESSWYGIWPGVIRPKTLWTSSKK